MNTPKLKCVVLEDEDDIRQWLLKKLTTYPELDLVGETASIDEAYSLIATTKPDVAFMDVHLIGGNAFTLLSRLQANGLPIPYIVMATGYPDYVMTALNDYRQYIVQYLVKPFIEDWRTKFRKAIDALLAAKMKDLMEKETIITTPTKEEPPQTDFIFIQNKGKLLRLDFAHIAYLEVAGGGESIIVMDNTYHVVALTLVKCMALLPAYFIRISKSNIININRVVTVNRTERTVEISCAPKNKTIGISDTYYAAFMNRLPLV